MRVLVVNVGSSSLKLRLLDDSNSFLFSEDFMLDRRGVLSGMIASAISSIAGQVDAVGHRVVHGGTRFTGPVVIDRGVEEELRALADLAPLHQAKSLAGLDAVNALLAGIPTVACFDTAFHATMPEEAATYALPAEWRERFGVRRYGFHGLSHAYASAKVAELLDRPIDQLRIITCHLGAGASLAAVVNGASVDTTMGFTPLEGLMMATRSGSVDPGIVTWLIQHKGVPPDELADTLENSSGLLAIAGTADMADIEARASLGDTASTLAISMYVHRLRAGIASMASAMNGTDAMVFTGGVGENSAVVRARAVEGLEFLGAQIDERINDSAKPDSEITSPGSIVRTFIIGAREDLQIASEVRALLGAGPT